MLPFSLPSFSKLNLSLRILGKREDGFHELFTVFQTVSLHDSINFEESDELRVICDDRGVPTDSSNLILRAAGALKDMTGCQRGAVITLDKRIPSPGGLGGGSSNAAITLIGLCRLWELNVNVENLQRMAAKLGSDVPFFLRGGTAIGTGRGEVIEEVAEIETDQILVVTPDVAVSTPEAFAAAAATSLTLVDLNRILRDCRSEAESLDLRHSALINDLEKSVFASYPEIARVKHALLDLGAVNAAMSGSGASVFAIFDKKETRQAAEKALDRESTWRKFVVATISRSEYREALRC